MHTMLFAEYHIRDDKEDSEDGKARKENTNSHQIE